MFRKNKAYIVAWRDNKDKEHVDLFDNKKKANEFYVETTFPTNFSNEHANYESIFILKSTPEMCRKYVKVHSKAIINSRLKE